LWAAQVEDGDGGGGDDPPGESGGDGGNNSDGPGGEDDEGSHGSEGQASTTDREMRSHGTAEEMPKGATPDVAGPAHNSERAKSPRGDRSSLLYRAAPKRVMHIGEPTEVGDYGTPLSVLKQRERIRETNAHAGYPAEQRSNSAVIDLGRRTSHRDE